MNTSVSSSPNFLLWGAGIVLGFVSIILILLRVDTYMKYKAINDCASISRFEQTTDNQRYTYPVQDIYEACLKKKGL